MNAASFLTLEVPVSAAVPAEAGTTAALELSTSGNGDVFAALVDEAFVRRVQGQIDLPVLELAAKPAELPEEVVEGSSEVERDSSEPERPKSEPLPDLNILLISQSFFIAPTLPVTWVLPVELPASSSAKTGDELTPAVGSAVQGETLSSSAAGEPVQISSPQPTPAQTGQTDSSTSISGTMPSVRTGNGGRLDLVELGFKPVVESNLPEPVLPNSGVETKRDDRAARPQPFSERQDKAPERLPPLTLSLPVATAPLPDVPAVTANALRFATVAVVPEKPSPVAAEQGTPAVVATGAELPVAMAESANVAQSSPEVTVARNAPQKSQSTSKASADAGSFKVESAPARMLEPRGTPAAKEELRMESFSNAEQAGTGPTTGGTDDVAEESPSTGAGPGLRYRDADNADFSRNVGATDWQTGRPVSRNDRPAPDSQAVRGPEAARSIEQLSGLVMRETAVLQQHTPDSMAVVLRPDAQTELFLHLTQRDGQIEASVRCERGNFDQLNALWPQLQESLAGQKVRLAPLQESTEPQRDSQGASGHTMNFSESEQRSRRQSMPEDDSTSDRPSSAPPSTVSLHPERRRSGTRPTASRPGWETWA